MAISTYKVFLMHKGGEDMAYKMLIPIKSFPDLGGDPELLETTTLCDNMQTFIAGIQSMDGLNFTANYDLTQYKTLKALQGKKDEEYAVWFGGTENTGSAPTPTGADGKFKFKGELSAYPVGGGVNEVVDMNITIAPSTVISLDET